MQEERGGVGSVTEREKRSTRSSQRCAAFSLLWRGSLVGRSTCMLDRLRVCFSSRASHRCQWRCRGPFCERGRGGSRAHA